MNAQELQELIANGENSGVEFKREDVTSNDFAREVAAFVNSRGGKILLGIADDGRVVGVTRPDLEEWVMNVCYDRVRPGVIPYYEEVTIEGNRVAAITVESGPLKPYWVPSRGGRRVYYVRVGSEAREASPEQLARLIQTAGALSFDTQPVPGATIGMLDEARLRQYFTRYRPLVVDWDELTGPERARLLINTEILTELHEQTVATLGGLLLFAREGGQLKRFLPQSGITAVRFRGTEPEYTAYERRNLTAPLVSVRDDAGHAIDYGLIDQAMHFVQRHTQLDSVIVNGARQDRWVYPLDAVREVAVNAVAHRDYTIAGTDISLFIFDNRLEVRSPGRLPNTITIARMRTGCRYARNQLLVNLLRDYRYVEHTGMGIPYKVIPAMRAHNGTEPLLEEREEEFCVTLWASSARGRS